MLQLTIWSLPSLVTVLLSFHALSKTQGRANKVPGARALQGLCACVIVWAMGQLAGTLTPNLELKVVASQLQYVGIALVPVAWFCFALTYVRRVAVVDRRLLAALMTIPAVTVALAWSNGAHHLLWTDVRLVSVPGFVGMSLQHGPWFDVNVGYSYALIAAGMLILVYELSASRRHRSALFGVVLGPTVVAAFNVAYLSGHGPRFIDLTPLGFALGAIVFARRMLPTGMLLIPPALHRAVLEELADGVLVLDSDLYAVDANAAARRMLGVDAVEASADAVELLVGRPLLADVVASGCRETCVDDRSYEVRATPVHVREEHDSRHTVLVFRDITERLRAERTLQQVKQEMEYLAHTDTLTDVPNRRYFMRRLQEETARCQRSGDELSVVLLDLDHFKDVNDTYGHDTGDRVLRTAADIIRMCIRGGDIAARWGGEEFALLLPQTSIDEARGVAERICTAIAQRVFHGEAAGTFTITASAGIATAGPHGGGDALKLADQALYRAKDAGRNAVCS